jgi:hypothetical protein
MSDIRTWSTSAGSNQGTATGGMTEGQAPSTVNDQVRVQMAAHRTQWEDAEWFDWGHVPAYVSASTFTVSNSVTTVYAVGRRLKLYDGSTLYGHVTSISAVSGTNTKFTVSLTSGNLTSSLSSVAVAILDPTNTSIPKGATLDTPTINGTATGTTWTGHVIQVVNTTFTSNSSNTTSIPLDDSIPQNTEGTELFTRAITPTNASNLLRIDVTVYHGNSTDTASNVIALFQDSTASALAAVAATIGAAGGSAVTTFTHYMTAGTTSSTTFKVHIGTNAGTWSANPAKFGGIESSSITIMEIKA